MKSELENSLSVVKVWKILLKADVRLYPDGFYRLKGIFGDSVAFGHLSITRENIKIVRNHDGSLKEHFLDKLARFMSKNRPKMPSLSNSELVILGLSRLITSESLSKANV